MATIVLDRSRWAIRERGLGQGVYVKCPRCGIEALLSHAVDRRGVVTPALSCPTIGCGFHEDVALQGWPEGHTAINGSMLVLRIPKPGRSSAHQR